MRDTWERKPFKHKRASPQSSSDTGPKAVILVDLEDVMSKISESTKTSESQPSGCVPFPTHIHPSTHIHPTNANQALSISGVNGNLKDLSIEGHADVYECGDHLGPEATVIVDSYHNSQDNELSDVVPEPSPVLYSPVKTRCKLPELADQLPQLDCSGSECGGEHSKHCNGGGTDCLDSVFSEGNSLPSLKINNASNRSIVQKHEEAVEERCRSALQNSCIKVSSQVRVGNTRRSLGTNEDHNIECASLGDIFLDMGSLAASLRSGDVPSDPIPQGSTIMDPFSRSHSTTSSSCTTTTTTSSAEASSVSGSTETTHSHPRAYATNLSRCRRRHRDRPARVRILRRPRKILVLGDMMSGKSNLISAYCTDRFSEDYVPTFLRCLQTDADVSGEKINLVVIEISGRDDFEPLRRYAYHKMDAAIICYPVDSGNSLERIRDFWVPELKRHAPKAPFVVVGTKRDIRDEARDRVEEYKVKLRGEGEEAEMAGRIRAEAAFAKEFVSHDRGKRMSSDLGALGFYECCSMYRDGTRRVFEGIAKIAMQKSRRKRKMSSKHVDNMCTIL